MPPLEEWKPLLDGDLATEAHAALDAIADALGALDAASGSPEPSSYNLSSGMAGRALFHAYRGLARPDDGPDHADDERAMELVSVALDAGTSRPMGDTLFHGLTGIAWTLEHFGRHFFDLGDDDPFARFDAHILSRIDQTRRDSGFELMRGLIGHGVYALERLPRPSARAILDAVVIALEQMSTSTDDGVAWFTPPEHLGADAAFAPRGYFNLGLAHGVAAAIPFLARCAAAGVDPGRVEPLLDGAIAWLLEQRRPEDGPHTFPAFVTASESRPPAHAGWCYGDPGLACALLVAGDLAGEPSWSAAGRDIALAIAARSIDELGLDDAGLCHGACGTGHLFNRMYQGTGEPALAAAARACFRRGLAMRAPGRGVGGFQELDPEAPEGRADTPGLLAGAAGIGLTLLAAVTDHAPSWDAVFLVGA